MAGLRSVTLRIVVGGDGVDSTSAVDFQVLYQNRDVAASYHLASTEIGDHANWTQDLDVQIPLTPDQVNEATFYLNIVQPRPNDHDHFQGDISLRFIFADGQVGIFEYGGFAIGTYNESSSTRKNIKLDLFSGIQAAVRSLEPDWRIH
jgi:hypothetical protein